jgi:hypothetical protein
MMIEMDKEIIKDLRILANKMNNKLDSFNRDKTKCKKCKKYYDYSTLLCDDCEVKWELYFEQNWDKYRDKFGNSGHLSHDSFFKEFLNDWCSNEQ